MRIKLASVAAALACLGQPAMAAYTINVSEVGGKVVASGSGTINTNALPLWPQVDRPGVQSGIGRLYLGGTPGTDNLILEATHGLVSGPHSFGTSLSSRGADLATGVIVGIVGNSQTLFVPAGYTSGSLMTSSATWNGATFASLGLNPGTYTWSWGAGADADTFTVQIDPLPPATTASIPTLSEWALTGLSGLVALFGISRIRRRR